MKIAALFDIHGNLPALNSVLEELSQLNVDKIIIGGDIVSGPMPNETLETLFQIKDKIVWIGGNGDDDVLNAICNKPLNSNLSDNGRLLTDWVANQLGERFIDFLKELPLLYDLVLPGYGSICFCHATPKSKEEIFTPITNEQSIKEIFENINYNIIICGHTHVQFQLMANSIKIMNAGSVGMPFGRNKGADWILITPDEILFKNTQYDYMKAEKILMKTNYPAIENFVEQYIVHNHNEKQMIEYLEKLRTYQTRK